MALFKINRGKSVNLPETKTEGYCYITLDGKYFFFDFVDDNGVLQRGVLNASNADTATKLANSRKINLSGDLSGFASFDGASDITINAVVADNSHNHEIINITGLEAALNGKTNQNAFSNIKVGSVVVGSTISTDTLQLEAGSNITLTPTANDKKIKITAKDTTYSAMTGATASAAGTSGLVPAPAAGKNNSFLRGDGTWALPNIPTYTLSSFGITATAEELNYTDGVTSNIQTQLNAKQAKASTVTANLTVAGWSNKTQTITVSGVTASNTVIVGPNPSSEAEYSKNNVICTAQGNNSLTFSCGIVPTTSLSINVIIL